MSDLICRKTMMRCQTPGMCAPHGGCFTGVLRQADVRYAGNAKQCQQPQAHPDRCGCVPQGAEQVSSAWLAQLREEYRLFGEQNAQLAQRCSNLETVQQASIERSGRIKAAAGRLGWTADCKDGALEFLIERAERCRELEVERDEADRRAGSAERRLADAKSSRGKHDSWKRKAKFDAGYHDNTSFDVVWKETLEKAAEVERLHARVAAAAECLAGWHGHEEVPRTAVDKALKILDTRESPSAESEVGQLRKDAEQLMWLIDEEARIHGHLTQHGLRYGLVWPDGSQQADLFECPRAAIGAAMEVSRNDI